MRRVACIATAAVAARAVSFTPKTLKSTDPTYEDDRWLEAQFADKEKTPEERYADQKQRELMKSLVSKMRAEHQAHTEKVVTAKVQERDSEIGDLKKMIADLSSKIETLQKK